MPQTNPRWLQELNALAERTRVSRVDAERGLAKSRVLLDLIEPNALIKSVNEIARGGAAAVAIAMVIADSIAEEAAEPVSPTSNARPSAAAEMSRGGTPAQAVATLIMIQLAEEGTYELQKSGKLLVKSGRVTDVVGKPDAVVVSCDSLNC